MFNFQFKCSITQILHFLRNIKKTYLPSILLLIFISFEELISFFLN